MGWLATILFGFSKMAVSAMLWMVRLAFTFDVTQYRSTVGSFASDIDQQLVHLGEHPLSLFDVVWFVLFAYAGFQALRGRVGRAGREILASVVLAGVGVVLLGNFFPQEDGTSFRSTVSTEGNRAQQMVPAAYEDGGYFDSFGDMLNMSAVAMLLVAEGEDPDVEREDATDQEFVEGHLRGDGTGDDRGTLGRLHEEFIERPYFFINYNKATFEDRLAPSSELPGSWYDQLTCGEVTTHLLTMESKEGSWPSNFLRRNGCGDEAQWNGEMGLERLTASVLVTAVGVIVAVLVGLAALTLLMSKFLVAVFFVALPVAVVMALLPGQARRLALGWGTSLLQLWLAALGMGLVLAVLMMGMDSVYATTDGRNLGERWVMILLLVSTVYMLRKKIVGGTQTAAAAAGAQLTSFTSGQAPNWNAATSTSLDLMGADRGAARAGALGQRGALTARRAGMRAAGTAARTAGRSGWWMAGGPWRLARQRRQENRMARKAQLWHSVQGRVAAEHTAARDITGGGKEKADHLAAVATRHKGEVKALGRDEMRRAEKANFADRANQRARHEEAAVGRRDAHDVHGALTTRAGLRRRLQPLTGDRAQAAQRLGLSQQDINQWNAAARGPYMPQSTKDLQGRMLQGVKATEAGLNRRAAQSGSPPAGIDAGRLQGQWNASGSTSSYEAREHHRLTNDAGYAAATARDRARQAGSPLQDDQAGQRMHERHQAENEVVERNFKSRQEAQDLIDG